LLRFDILSFENFHIFRIIYFDIFCIYLSFFSFFPCVTFGRISTFFGFENAFSYFNFLTTRYFKKFHLFGLYWWSAPVPDSLTYVFQLGWQKQNLKSVGYSSACSLSSNTVLFRRVPHIAKSDYYLHHIYPSAFLSVRSLVCKKKLVFHWKDFSEI